MAYRRKTVRGDYNHLMGGDGRSRPSGEKYGDWLIGRGERTSRRRRRDDDWGWLF